jgi:alpha-D-ribose 1-methylphosphonate 5-triphosphate synthase subunit PhnL
MKKRTPVPPAISVDGLAKTFTLHTQGGARIPVFAGLRLDVAAGECVALHGPSGSGKSTLMRALFANYKADSGTIHILHDGEPVDIAAAPPRTILDIRRRTIGYVSQFLRVIPRVPTRDIVAEPLRALGMAADDARARAEAMLARLNIPEPLWSLAPATFSGGEQQRVNVARGFVADYPILLLDEPTASLDAANRQIVVELIGEAKARGAAIVGIFHDAATRAAVADRLYEMAPVLAPPAATTDTAIGDAA